MKIIQRTTPEGLASAYVLDAQGLTVWALSLKDIGDLANELHQCAANLEPSAGGALVQKAADMFAALGNDTGAFVVTTEYDLSR